MSPGVRDTLRVLLECQGFQTRLFVSCRDFLAADRGSDGDCLLLDLHMPQISGIALLERMRQRGDMLPVIIITGRLDATIQDRAPAAGALAVIEKPYKAAEILDLARKASRPTNRPLVSPSA